jgi:hypothetical protein
MKKKVLFAVSVFMISAFVMTTSAQSQNEAPKDQRNGSGESSSRNQIQKPAQVLGQTQKTANYTKRVSVQAPGRRSPLYLPIDGFIVAALTVKHADARWFIDSGIGVATSLGFKQPDTNFGLALEKPIGSRFEYQAVIGYSPSRKAITNDGNTFLASTQMLFWVRNNLAILGGISYSKLWTSQFVKHGTFPLVGISIRENSRLFGPGRTYISYDFPTGCVWATPANPCTIQSNRLQGVDFAQEFNTFSHLRIVLEYGFYHFADQGNPFAPNVPRSTHFAITSQVVLRFAFHKLDQDRVY